MTPSRWVRWTLGIVALLGAVGCGERKPPAGPAIAPSSPAPAPQSDEELPYYLKEDIVGDTAREEPFAEEALLYRWRGDEPYNYDLKATVEHGDAVTETTASLVYYLDSVGEPMVAGLPPDNVFFEKNRSGLANSLRWLDANLDRVLAVLPRARHFSYLEVCLFCLLEHLSFRATVEWANLPRLAAFARDFARHPAALATEYRFDAQSHFS